MGDGSGGAGSVFGISSSQGTFKQTYEIMGLLKKTTTKKPPNADNGRIVMLDSSQV